jgi:hypothetical protein
MSTEGFVLVVVFSFGGALLGSYIGGKLLDWFHR